MTTQKISRIAALFPDPDPVVQRKYMVAERAKSKLTPRERYLKGAYGLMLALIIVGLIIEFAIGFIFNDRLVSSSLREELTATDQILRGAGAMGMVVAIMGIAFAIHVTFKSTVAMPYRVVAFLAAIVIGVGIYFVAGSIGHQVFSGLFDKIWGGSASSPDIALDPTQVTSNAQAGEQTPFWLRLMASSALFVGVAFFVAICELIWLNVRDRLAQVRELMGEANLIISKCDAANDAKVRAIKAEQELNLTQDQEYQKTFIMGKVASGQQAWRSTIESLRSDTTNIARLSPEEYKQRKGNDSKIDIAIGRAEVIESDHKKVQELVEQLFAKVSRPQAST